MKSPAQTSNTQAHLDERASAQTADADPREIYEFKGRDRWMRAVLADAILNLFQKVVACWLALRLHVKSGGRCAATYAEIGAGVGRNRRTAMRAVARLIARGWLAPTTSGGRHANDFRLLMATPNGDSMAVTVESPNSDSLAVTVEPPNGDTLAVTVDGVRPANSDKIERATVTACVTDKRLNEGKRNEERKGSQTLHQRDDNKIDASETLFGDDAAPKRASKKNLKTSAAAIEAAFGVAWPLYPKRRGRGHASKAFAAAIKKGADAEQIIEGVRRFARDPGPWKYIPHFAKWLSGECWLDEPAPNGGGGTLTIDQDGNPIETAPHADDPRYRNTGGSTTFTEIAAQRAEERRRG
jgi:hypothetical protein